MSQRYHTSQIIYIGYGLENRQADFVARVHTDLRNRLRDGDTNNTSWTEMEMLVVPVPILENITATQAKFFEKCLLKHSNLDYLANKIHGTNPLTKAKFRELCTKLGRNVKDEGFYDLEDDIITATIARFIYCHFYDVLSSRRWPVIRLTDFGVILDDNPRNQLDSRQRHVTEEVQKKRKARRSINNFFVYRSPPQLSSSNLHKWGHP